jgi:hypothetical protein
MEESVDIRWNEQLEEILSKEGERSLCYSWLHNKSQKRYASYDTNLALPVIILSTIAGTGSIASPSLFGNSQGAGLTIGLISLTVGVMNTISSYFSFAKRSESHKIAAITYSKLYKFIVIELSLPRKERMKAKDMLKIIREQSERLSEISPQIPDAIIKLFNDKFHEDKEISKPEITNGLDPIHVYVEGSEKLTPVMKQGVKISIVQDKYPSVDETQTLRPPPSTSTPNVVPKISIPGRTPDK